jgi:hypothetical protein
MSEIAYDHCRHTAFLSYAHADNAGNWIDIFEQDLSDRLEAALKRTVREYKSLHLSQKNGPITGSLPAQLRERVQQSFALILLVRANYLESEWCLQELEYFRQAQRAHFPRRLYVVALGFRAIQELVARPKWAELGLKDYLWIPAYRNDHPDHRELPIEQYFKVNDRAVQQDRYSLLLDKLTAEIKSEIEAAQTQPRGTRAAMPADLPSPEAQAVPHPTPPPQRRKIVFGAVLDAPLAAWSTHLQSELLAQDSIHGLELENIPATDLDAHEDGDTALLERMAGADSLVLPFNRARLRQPVGGHLQMQADAWLQAHARRNPPPPIHWLNACDAVAPDIEANAPSQREFIAQKRRISIDADGLRQLLLPRDSKPRDTVNILIESNNLHADDWIPLGQRIHEIWKDVVQQQAVKPPLELQYLSMSLDDASDGLERDDLASYDAVILLWGNKPKKSVYDQVKKLSHRVMHDRGVPMGRVAMLIPPQDAEGPVPANGWNVVRFRRAADNDGYREADEHEHTSLHRFLVGVLKRHLGGLK